MANGMAAMFRTALELYEQMGREACDKHGLQPSEMHVLLFLANNPERNTAIDIHRFGGMKQSMISTIVEKLVQKEFIERQAVPGDRRKVKLICTEKAAPAVAAGRQAQKRFAACCTEGISSEDLEIYTRVQKKIAENMMNCREKMLRGEDVND